jgi:hypothetical protein
VIIEVVNDDRGEVVARVVQEEDGPMIAAAPAMLAALRDIETIGGAGVIERRETGKPTWHALDAIKDAARAAIARAEGGPDGLTPGERDHYRRAELDKAATKRVEGGR